LGGQASVTIDTTGADFIVCCTAPGPGIGDTLGNTWNNLTDVTMGSGGRGDSQIVWSRPTNLGVDTITGSSAHQIVCAWYKGSLASPFDAQATHSDTGSGHTTLTTGSITPGQNNSLIIAQIGIDDPFNSGAVPLAIGSGFTVLSIRDVIPGAAYGCAFAELYQTTGAAAVNPTWTRSNANSQVGDGAGIAAFKFSAPPAGRSFLLVRR
jgi:hypothetical protein